MRPASNLARFIIALIFGLNLNSLAFPAKADEGINLRDRFAEFSKAAQQRRWKIEDEIIRRERLFQDGLQQEYREVVLRGLDRTSESSKDWRTSRRMQKDLVREVRDRLRQKVRVHREEFELTFQSTSIALERELQEFLQPIEEKLRTSLRSDAFERARSDFDSAKDELKEELRAWREGIKSLKTGPLAWGDPG